MAQETNALWKTLWRTPNAEKQYQFTIDGVEYGADSEVEHSVSGELYEDFGIGNAAIATLKMSLYADDIPRQAEIRRFVRLVNGDQFSEWLPAGVFYANRRVEDDGYWTVEAMDALRKADVVWLPDDSLEFPMSMSDAVDALCEIIGVEQDSRNSISDTYQIDYPANDWTVRDVLRFIAAANGGNFIMSDSGKLRLVPLLSAPEPTHYLVTEHGDPIVIGGVRILV